MSHRFHRSHRDFLSHTDFTDLTDLAAHSDSSNEIICEIREICVTKKSEICVPPHLMQLCVRNEPTMAVSTVMINWMMVFQVLRFLNILQKI